MELNDYRTQIDQIDEELFSLFRKRMEISKEIAAYKKENGLSTYDETREKALMRQAEKRSGEALCEYGKVLASTLIYLSRSYQNRLNDDFPLGKRIQNALETTKKVFPKSATVACQGVEGAYSMLAAERFFASPEITYHRSFQDVFAAIENGESRYGVLPIENSTAGSVNQVYDLMRKHQFFIVRSLRLKISHNLLALPGASLEDIREIVSHEQALNQSTAFLSSLKDVKTTVCANTAVAAKTVAESGRKDLAALSSRNCAALYHLAVLKESVQDQGNNCTRFICIAKEPEIYPGADKTSLVLSMPHKPGSLYHLLSLFYSHGVNLTKIESRPIPERDFEFLFYFDLEQSVYEEGFLSLLAELSENYEDFRYLGSYNEII